MKELFNNPTFKKVWSIVSNVLLYLFIAICLIGVLLTITAKKDEDGTATIFGMQMRLVISPSMEKCDATDVSDFEIKDIPVNSMVFIEVVPTDPTEAEKWYDELEVGDVLTFKYVYTRQETITHRITNKTEKPTGGYIIELTGDNKNSDSQTLTQIIDTSNSNSPEYIIGKVTGQSYILGLFISVLKSPLGLILIVILPSLVIMIFEIVKVVKIVTAEKRQKEQEEKEQQQNELDELRRRLAELEASKAATTDTAADEGGTDGVNDGE